MYSHNGIIRLNTHRSVTDFLDRAISLKPDNADAYYYKGVALSDLGRNKRLMTMP